MKSYWQNFFRSGHFALKIYRINYKHLYLVRLDTQIYYEKTRVTTPEFLRKHL